ncbi:MAG: ATP-binding cassette domain-containing protein, partial [Spirochaetia bacterium]|nr:ATP-binding cassette domain-containing protein [Spirochaetia bacterium]
MGIKNLYKSYDGHSYAVNDLSFEVQANDFVVLLGLSGSGKSTL